MFRCVFLSSQLYFLFEASSYWFGEVNYSLSWSWIVSRVSVFGNHVIDSLQDCLHSSDWITGTPFHRSCCLKIVMILKNYLLIFPFPVLQEKQCFLHVTKCEKSSWSVFNTYTRWLSVASSMQWDNRYLSISGTYTGDNGPGPGHNRAVVKTLCQMLQGWWYNNCWSGSAVCWVQAEQLCGASTGEAKPKRCSSLGEVALAVFSLFCCLKKKIPP